MTQLMLGVAGFVLMLGLLIFIHELGHFLAAKMFGVKVEVFSIGFVGSIFSFRWGETHYRLGWLPLGGYVKMFGEEQGTIRDPQLQKRAFSHKPLWQRALIVLAGPFANLVVLPVLVLGGMFLSQDKELSTTIGTVLAGRPAAEAGLQAGDRILSVDGESVRYFRELRSLIEKVPGQKVTLRVKRDNTTLTVPITPSSYEQEDVFGGKQKRGLIGITAGFRTPVVGVPDPNSPAYKAGLRTFDRLIAINGQPVQRWEQVEAYRSKHPKGPYRYTFRRRLYIRTPVLTWEDWSPPRTVTVTPVTQTQQGKTTTTDGLMSAEGFVETVFRGTPFAEAGIQRGDRLLKVGKQAIRTSSDLTTLSRKSDSTYEVVYLRDGKTHTTSFKLTPITWVDPFKQRHKRIILGVRLSTPYANGVSVPIQKPLRYAMKRSVEETWRYTYLIALSIKKLFTQELPAESIGGPLMIYQIAQEAVKNGWEIFLQQLILISINLGLLNLLPIPILDGGHLMFFAIEAVIRRPVPAKVRYWALMLGFGFLLFLILFATRNDLLRWFAP